MARSIYEMRLHEIVNTEFYSILRVAGGWIYSCIVYKTSVFVPWHNEFQQANAPQQTNNNASLPCLCEDCTRRTLGSCRPNTNSRVTACEGYTRSRQAVA